MINYIIFHPEQSRCRAYVKATAEVCGEVINDWLGCIYVDAIDNTNEDPFVFDNPWLYSYCHASQLKRRDGLKSGSTLIFVSGDKANKGYLTIDTIFHIGQIEKWPKKLILPTKYHIHRNNNSKTWRRHLCFPFPPHNAHSSVSHTYEAKMWEPNEDDILSFIPLENDGQRVTIPFNCLSETLIAKINNKIRGKRPVEISSRDINNILEEVKRRCKIKVLKSIDLIISYMPHVRIYFSRPPVCKRL